MEYRHLNLSDYETRFLRILEPDASNSLIRAEIVTASLTRAPKYAAFSYTWGNERLTECIQIDGRDVFVARNVKAALKELNLAEGTLIWIDALCINQNDLYEKSYQVGIMGEIYSRAETVIAWLGEADANTEQAIMLLNNIAGVLRGQLNGTGDKTGLGKRYLTGAIRTSDDPSRALRGLIDLLTRPFWERVWIIQEIAKARRVTVCCGRFQTSLEPIWKVFQHVPKIELKAKDLLEAINRFRSSQSSVRVDGITLLEALLITRHSQATEPRDRVYALLNVTTDGRELVPLADYNTPLETVFSEITLRMLARNQQSVVTLLASRTFNSWQSTTGHKCSRLAVHWAELHENVPDWIVRSALAPENISAQHTISLQDSDVRISGAHIATVVDCEASQPEAVVNFPYEIEETFDQPSLIADTVKAYAKDILYICAELDPDAWAKADSVGDIVPTFVVYLRTYRDREQAGGTNPKDILLSPLQRIGLLRYPDRMLLDVVQLYDKKTPNPSEVGVWMRAETQLEEEPGFGMQFGVVRREVRNGAIKPRLPSSSILSKVAKAMRGNTIDSGIVFLCKKARSGDMLFLLPGLRHPVVLRPLGDRRYCLIGESILRLGGGNERMRDIFIQTQF